MASDFGAPFRAPCGGWPAASRNYVGGCWQNKRNDETAVARYPNITSIKDWLCDVETSTPLPNRLPYNRPENTPPGVGGGCGYVICLNGHETATTVPDVCIQPCAPWDFYALNAVEAPIGEGTYDYNRYPTDPTGTVDMSKCRKIGFKNVQAAKVWHGRYGFNSGYGMDGLSCATVPTGCGCSAIRAEMLTAPQTKYLSKQAVAEINGSYNWQAVAPTAECALGLNVTGTLVGSVRRSYAVAPLTGVVTQGDNGSTDSLVITSVNSCEGGGSWDYGGLYPAGGGLNITIESLKDLTKLTAECGKVKAANDNAWALLNGKTISEVVDFFLVPETSETVDLGDVLQTNTYKMNVKPGTYELTDNVLRFTVEEVAYRKDVGTGPVYTMEGTLTNTISVSITLGTPYTWESVQSDCLSLLNEWAMNDDILYPWRTDDFVSIAPLVTRREVKAPVSPDTWFDYTMMETPPNDFTYRDPNNPEYFPEAFAEPFDGSIRGSPLPCRSPIAPFVRAYGPQFDFQHYTWKRCVGDAGASYYRWVQGAWGNAASQCVDEGEEPMRCCTATPYCSYDATDVGIPATATQWTENYSQWHAPAGDMPIGSWIRGYGGICYAQKWAETVVPRRSWNYARPCGEDRDLLDELTVCCVQSASGGDTVNVLSEPVAHPILTGDKVYVCGCDTMGIPDGYYSVTHTVGTTAYTLSTLPYWPGTSPTIANCGTGIIGKIRWPDAPGFCRPINVVSATDIADTGLVAITLEQPAPYLKRGDHVDFTDVGTLGTNLEVIGIVSSSIFNVTGSVPTYAGGGSVKVHGAADYQWDDKRQKGDYLYLTWELNYRDFTERDLAIARYADCSGCTPAPPAPGGGALREHQASEFGISRAVSAFTFTDSDAPTCREWSVCYPHVLCITNNTDLDTWGEVGQSYLMGLVASGDEAYLAQWQGAFAQQMEDPMWQAPHAPCVSVGGSTTLTPKSPWEMDDGACGEVDGTTAGDYPRQTLVEARSDKPTGAPTPPVPYRVLTFSEWNTASSSAGLALVPPDGLGYKDDDNAQPNRYSTAWAIYMAQEACVCGSGPFATEYHEDGVICQQ